MLEVDAKILAPIEAEVNRLNPALALALSVV